MKKMIKYLVLLTIFLNNIHAKQYTFYDLQNLMNAKYGVTLLIDKDIMDKYVIYSDNLIRDITLDSIRSMSLTAGYNYKKTGNLIQISQKSKPEQKALERDVQLDHKRKEHQLQMQIKQDEKDFTEDDFFLDGIKTDLPRKAVDKLCKQMRYDCTYISNGAYIVRAKNDIIDLSLFKKYKAGEQYALVGTIIELNKNILKDKSIDINAFANSFLTSRFLDLSLMGQYGSFFNDQTGQNKISFDAVLKFFSSKGIADIKSKPYLLLEDGEDTSFSTGQSLMVAADTVTNTERAITQTNYTTLQIGLTIKAKPEFSKSFVYVRLNLDISSLLDYDKEKNIANIANRTLSGKYRLVPGKEIKLVGFDQNYKNSKTYKIPILGDIPILGELFRSRYNDDKNTLLLVKFKLERIT